MLTLTPWFARTDKTIVWPIRGMYIMREYEYSRKTGNNKSEIRALIVVANYIRPLLNFSLCHFNLIFLANRLSKLLTSSTYKNYEVSLLWWTNEWDIDWELLLNGRIWPSPDTCKISLICCFVLLFVVRQVHLVWSYLITNSLWLAETFSSRQLTLADNMAIWC